EADGWIELVNTCDEHSGSIVVSNTAGRNNGAVSEFGATLNGSLEELRRRLIALWVINRQRDALELLKDFMTAIPDALVHVVRIAHFGDERKFELYNGSKVRGAHRATRGKDLMLSPLA